MSNQFSKHIFHSRRAAGVYTWANEQGSPLGNIVLEHNRQGVAEKRREVTNRLGFGFDSQACDHNDERLGALWFSEWFIPAGFDSPPPCPKDNNWQGVAEKVNAIGFQSQWAGMPDSANHESHAGCKSLPPCRKDNNWQGVAEWRRSIGVACDGGLAITVSAARNSIGCYVQTMQVRFLPPCLKDRRDETPGFNGLWFPVSRGLNKKPLLQPLQECCRPGWNHAGRVLPSRRKIKEAQ